MKVLVISIFVAQISLFAQCDPEYTVFHTIPSNVNVINGDSCFFTNDLDVLDSLIGINDLDYNTSLELGTQTWNNGRLKILVAGNYGNDTGVNDTIFTLPENIGNWDQLSALYLEWNRISTIPEAIGQLSTLQSLYISNNVVQDLPINIGDLSNLYLLDAGYNEIDSLPESFCNLDNLTYLWLFNNELTTVPACMCSLDLNWDETDAAWYPYFAIGGNQLCEAVPECISGSAHFHTSLDQFYYSFMVTDSQDCETSSIINDNIPSRFALLEPYPNPFNPITTIRFSVEARHATQLRIYDITGRVIEILVNEKMQAGEHEIQWNASNHASGIYFVELVSGDQRDIQKLILMK